MTFLAIFIFSAALIASLGAILLNISAALPRIAEVIETEFAPAARRERQIHYGAVKQHQAMRTAEVVAFPLAALVEREYRLAA